MARAGIYGGLCVQDGYASDRWKTAEVLSNIGSSAGILYLRDYVPIPTILPRTSKRRFFALSQL